MVNFILANGSLQIFYKYGTVVSNVCSMLDSWNMGIWTCHMLHTFVDITFYKDIWNPLIDEGLDHRIRWRRLNPMNVYKLNPMDLQLSSFQVLQQHHCKFCISHWAIKRKIQRYLICQNKFQLCQIFLIYGIVSQLQS